MFNNISLQTKILIMFTAVIVFTISLITIYDSYTLRKAVKETYVSQLKGITTAINGRYEESRSVEDIQQMFDYIKHREPTVIQLNLHVKKGYDFLTLASTDRDLIGSPSPEILIPTLVHGQTMIAHLDQDKSESPKVRLVAPLIEDGSISGAIELYLNSAHDVALVQESIQLKALVGIALGLILLGMLYFIIRKMIVKPLLTLQEAAKSIQMGKPYEELDIQASSEINDVADAFNDMVINLEDRYYKSITDPLTGLYNSAFFEHSLTELMDQVDASNQSLGLLFCDVDNFKSLNDSEGHVFGDEVLRNIASTLRANVRSTDIVCRYGGEEFVIVLPFTDEAGAMRVAENIRQIVAIHGNHDLLNPITISIGLAMYPEDSDREQLVHLADQAMYTAKSLGKNRVVCAKELINYKKQDYRRGSMDNTWLLNTVISLARAVETKDSYTHSHSEMVSRYASAVASTMGLSDQEVKHISIAGLLHDVGKIGIPDHILNKEGRLTSEEYELMKTHPVLGYNIISSVNELEDILPFVLYHHERPDGRGYPEGLPSEKIPLGAKIIGVVDAFHSMTSARPYRKTALTIEEAIQELHRGRGTQFDEQVLDHFLTIVHQFHKKAG